MFVKQSPRRDSKTQHPPLWGLASGNTTRCAYSQLLTLTMDKARPPSYWGRPTTRALDRWHQMLPSTSSRTSHSQSQAGHPRLSESKQATGMQVSPSKFMQGGIPTRTPCAGPLSTSQQAATEETLCAPRPRPREDRPRTCALAVWPREFF